jgi:hypothetical protein
MMRRILVLVTVALIMVAMLAASALPAMASNGAEASGGAACNQGTMTAHESGVKSETAHINIPLC